MNKKKLNKILKEHKKWKAQFNLDTWSSDNIQDLLTNKNLDAKRAIFKISDNLSNVDLSHADLSCAILKGVSLVESNLYEINLSNASLNYSNLAHADLRKANLSGASLFSTNLYGANLEFADLSYTNLSGANLLLANLHGANLVGADLNGANLADADLSSARLSYTTLNNANLANTNMNDYKGYKGKILTESIIGYKICQDYSFYSNVLVTLEIPRGAIVFSINGDKCRTNKAKVIAIDGANRAISKYKYMSYYVGDEFTVYDFDCQYNKECSTGIHFFMTKEKVLPLLKISWW